MLGALLVVPVPVSAAAEEPAALSEGQRALVQAKEAGQQVEVVGERTEHTTVYANPDGYTFSLEESAVPVRVAGDGGDWEKPDPTLEQRADGSVGPKAAATRMSFSGGGDTALVKIEDRGRSLELGWPEKLPKPQLEGDSARYPEVLPDVDLKVTASVEGFRHVLVVKSPEAAARPELKQIDYSLRTQELKVREGAGGNLTATDGDGNTVFRAPPAQMWDSAGAATETGRAAVKSGSFSAAGSGDVTPTAEGAAPGVEPAPGDHVTTMDIEVSKGALAVKPDAEMLAKTDAAAFPLYIDPTVTWSESERTLLRSDGYESYGWGNGEDGLGKGAGKCGTWNNYSCGPGYVQRLYFEFSPASLKGKKVLDATFRITEPWAFQCDPRWVDLVRTNNISSSTTWSSRPKELDWMGDRSVSAGRGSLCDPDSPDAPIEFNDNPDESNENLTPTVRNFAAGKFSRLTLEIRAHDESDTGAWKRFKNDAVLSAKFVGLPAKPTGIGLVTGSGTVCEKEESDPAVVSDPTPSLTATAQTASGGEKDAQLRVYFDVDRKNSDASWSDADAGNGDMRPSTGYVGDGTKLSMPWSMLQERTLYRYRAWVRSYYDGGSYLSGPSNASTTGWCYFKVDPTAPKAPKITVGTPYTECTPQDCVPHGGPGQQATLTFAPASGDTNNVSYAYKLSTSASWSKAIPAAKPTVTVTPDRSGTYRVYVRATDDIGRPGAQSVLDFLVDPGEGAVGRWHFAEASGTAVDSATAGGPTRHAATLIGDATRDDRGRRGLITHDASGVPLENPVTDRGLSLNGAGAYAATSGPVLETQSSYTVSAWARVNPGATGIMTLLSEDGGTNNPFYLSYGADGVKDWSIRMLSKSPTAGNQWAKARGKQPSPTGVWTHVAATYDADNNKVRLYLNGVLQSEADAGTPWQAGGPLQIGMAKWGGVAADSFNGSVDEVAVWQRALGEKEIADEARLLTSDGYAGAELIADWNPSGAVGTTLTDTTSGYGRDLKLTGGASLDGEAIVLDGADDAAAANGPLVDDTGSFTVTTGVELGGDVLAGKSAGYTGQVLGQRTADGFAWGFWYELTGKDTVLDEETGAERTVPVGKWHFGRLTAGGTFSSVVSDEVAEVDSAARLTGVFDAQAGTISLYLGHNRNGDEQEFTALAGTGEFSVGRGFTSGVWKHYLPGRITDVRMWAGAMAGSEQIDTSVGD